MSTPIPPLEPDRTRTSAAYASLATRVAEVVAAAVAAAGCPSDPHFEASDVADTAVATDILEASDGDVAPCVPTCPSDMSVGACGDDGCGGTCFCTAASVCNLDGSCECLVGCESLVTNLATGPLAAGVDLSGRPLVATYRVPFPNQTDLVLASVEGFVWSPETVSEDVGPALTVGLAITSGGAPIVLWNEDAGIASPVAWAHRDGASWVTGQFLGLGNGLRPAIKRSHQGVIVASAVDRDTFDLRFARLVEGDAPSWEDIATLPGVGGLSSGISMVAPIAWTLDANDRPHVVHSCCGLESELRYDHWTGVQWRSESFGVVPRAGTHARMAVAIGIDRQGVPHVVSQWADGDAPTLVDRHWDGLQWITDELERVDAGVELGDTILLAEDSAHDFHLVYSKNARPVYRKLEGFEWTEAVGASGIVDAARPWSLTVDVADTPHVVYGDAAGQVFWWTPPDAH